MSNNLQEIISGSLRADYHVSKPSYHDSLVVSQPTPSHLVARFCGGHPRTTAAAAAARNFPMLRRGSARDRTIRYCRSSPTRSGTFGARADRARVPDASSPQVHHGSG